MTGLSVFHNSKFFFISRILFGAVFCAAGLESLDEFFNILHLSLVLKNGVEFDIPSFGHINGGVGLIGERAPDFLWHMRLEALGEQFREIDDVASSGKDRVKDNLSAGAVVGMVDAVKCEEILRVAGDEDIRLVPANFADDVTAEIKAWDDVSIRQVHEMRRVCSDHFGCVGLFRMSYPAQAFGSHFWMRGGIKSLVAAGQKNVGDVMSGACPASQCATAKEFGVVWVGKDNEKVLRGSPVSGL